MKIKKEDKQFLMQNYLLYPFLYFISLLFYRIFYFLITLYFKKRLKEDKTRIKMAKILSKNEFCLRSYEYFLVLGVLYNFFTFRFFYFKIFLYLFSFKIYF